MTEPLRDAYAVHAVKVEHRCHSMAELMRIYMWQVVPLAELLHPVGNAIRMHRVAVVLSEDEVPSVVICSKRSGKYGSFLGCTNWKPDKTGCNNTVKLDGYKKAYRH